MSPQVQVQERLVVAADTAMECDPAESAPDKDHQDGLYLPETAQTTRNNLWKVAILLRLRNKHADSVSVKHVLGIQIWPLWPGCMSG